MPNPLCHFELMSKDPQKCKAFYGALFDWKFDDSSMPGYTLVQTGADPGGGILPKPPQAPGACLNVYFMVEDVDITIAKAKENGGKLLVPKTQIPGVGEFAMCTDPEGIVVGLFKPAAG